MALDTALLKPAQIGTSEIATKNDITVASNAITSNIYYPNTTTIDGGKIKTGSITTDQLAMNTGWAGVIYNLGGGPSNYNMKIDFTNGEIHIK